MTHEAQRVLLLTDATMERHSAPGHPERRERLAAVAAGVEEGAADGGATLIARSPSPARDEAITAVHDAAYLAGLDAIDANGGGWLDPDTYVGAGSMEAARLAAGGAIDAALAVARGEAEVAFAVVRPPGHHAGHARASGFCLLNNVAIAVEALRAEGLADRVAIVDWDVHHGDGTQEIFDADADILYASTHQRPLYPGTGTAEERGSGRGIGTMHNVSLAPGDGDRDFVAAWTAALLPAIAEFGPDAILVSAGFDAHASDPLAHLEVTEAGYREVSAALGKVARAANLRGVAAVLEGGYDLQALQRSASATVSGLLAGLASGTAGGSLEEG